MSAPVTRNLVILLTDIKGFTDRTSHQSRAEMQQLLDRHKEVVLPVLKGRGGSLVKTMGDAFLMTFESPTNAVLAGIDVQAALARYNAGKPADERIEVRVAINQGEVNLADNDVFGEAVNITARIEAVADAGDVFFTEAVYLSMNKKEVPSSEVGLLQLKGIPEKIRVYRVKRENPVKALDASEPPSAGAASTEGGVRAAAGPRGSARTSGVAWKATAIAAAVVAAGFVARARRPSAPALAPEHALEVRVVGGETYAQTVNVSEGRQGNFVGPMLAADGRGGSRRAVFNVIVSSVEGRPGELDAAYQLDFAAGPADPASALKAQGDVELRRGGAVTAVECGRWKVELVLDGDGRAAAADAVSPGNDRVTAELSKGGKKIRCRQTLKPGEQGNVALGAPGKGSELIFNSYPGPSAESGAVDLQFQLEYRPRAGADLLQVQNQQTLALGKISRAQLSGYEFDLLAEGPYSPSAAR